MTEPTLSLLRNTFNNVTKANYKRMLLMSRDHHDKLKGFAVSNAAIDALYQQFLPAYTAFSTLYDKVYSNYAMYQGYTKLFENQIEELRSTLIRKWDVLIQVEYDQNSPEYTMLMSNGRSVFQTGAYELRISAVNQLYNNLSEINNPSFQSLMVMIDNWRTAAQAARSKQQHSEAEDKDLRMQLENARADLAVEMYGVFFGLAAIYYKDPSKVEMFYELKYLQANSNNSKSSNNQNDIEIAANTRKTIMSGNYTENDAIEIKNDGTVPVQIWISNDENSITPLDAPTVNNNETNTFFADELSDGTNPMKYIIVENKNNQIGKVSVNKLE